LGFRAEDTKINSGGGVGGAVGGEKVI